MLKHRRLCVVFRFRDYVLVVLQSAYNLTVTTTVR